jgi:hypothetical protein
MKLIKKRLEMLVSLIVFLCFIQGATAENHMSVSGKVINRETGKGVAGVDIILFEIDEGEEFESTTDREGKFMIKKIPKGKYEIPEIEIYMTCPEELIIDKMPKKVKISPEKNISDITIYLKKGATISGSVYGADGVTPLKGVEIVSDPWIRGKNESVFTNEQGKYRIVGVAKGEKCIIASALGFADESCRLDVKPGRNYDNKNFILGKGEVSVKGKVISEKDNQLIKDALLFFVYSRLTEHYSGGTAKTDKKGEYSIIGLKYPGIFKLNINHEEYECIDSQFVELKRGENILDFKLKPKKKLKIEN